MLISIGGSQGSGKSSVIAELTNRGYNTVQRKTSRSILSDWGVALHDINNDVDLSQKFQHEIISRKFSDEASAVVSNDVWFTERSYMDLFVYTLVNLGKDNRCSDWLDDYYNQCMEFQSTYRHIFYINGGKFNVQRDGIRASNQHYSKLVDLTMLEYTSTSVNSDNFFLIDQPQTVDDRVDFILDVLYDTDK